MLDRTGILQLAGVADDDLGQVGGRYSRATTTRLPTSTRRPNRSGTQEREGTEDPATHSRRQYVKVQRSPLWNTLFKRY